MNIWGLAAAGLIHIAFAVVVVLMPVAPKLPEVTEEFVAVEVVTLPPLDTPAVKQPEMVPQLPSVQQAEEAPVGKAELPPPASAAEMLRPEGAPKMVKPSLMLSEKTLSDPRSRSARQMLVALAPKERIGQLCDLEAMAQVAAWNKKFLPDRVVDYAMSNPKISDNSFVADGAALHSKHEWYNLRFKCELTPDHKKVAAFEFLMGDVIPKKEWEEHSLPDDQGELD